MRYAARSDANQAEIVEALRRIGCTVCILSRVGGGIPDVLAGRFGQNYLLEIKDGRKPPSDRKLTPDEAEFHATWRGQAAVVTNVDEAISVVTGGY